MGPLLILLLLVLAVLAAFVVAYNGLVTLRNQVRNAWQQIGVQLKRRHDLIPNLVEVVKDYMGYEQETLEKVIRARNQALTATGVQGTAAAEGALTGALRSLFAVVEAYPQLKANENVARLQEELTSTENRIAFARQFYNDLVMRFNTRIQVVPTNVVASLFGIKEEAYFEIPVAEQEPVKVDLR
ncbi:MAG: LemA family protein [Acidobacteria bacterium]|nr:LemA family protein [Acidobacteriota bacterium]